MNEPLTFDDYQRRALKTAIYPREYAVVYPALGLVGEAGEVCERLKRAIRDDRPVDWHALMLETGDMLWYCAALYSDLSSPLSGVALPGYMNYLTDGRTPYNAMRWALQASFFCGRVAEKVERWEYFSELHREVEIRVWVSEVVKILPDIARGYSLEDIARANLAKLADRADRGALQGEGDSR